jgi:serine/threonine-protein kinase
MSIPEPHLPAAHLPGDGAPIPAGGAARSESRALYASSDGGRIRLGDYEILGKIATGGMATVYRARKLAIFGVSREFAIKTIHPHLAEVPGFSERFLDEARLASKVRHPNVCAVLDAGEARGLRYLVLELVDGVTLRQLQLVGETPLLPADEAGRVITDVARGLDAVHELADDAGRSLDVIHRDLSPHNVMLDVTGRAVLIDLGLADAREKLGHTTTGVLCGKLPYMSPEQTLLDPLDRRSDVFSLGSVLFELVTGELPFGDDTRPDTLDRIRRADADGLRARLAAAKVPPWLVDILLTCLSADRDHRFATAGALADALEAAMHMRGYDPADARARLAARALATRARVGPLAPVDIAETALHPGLPTSAVTALPSRRTRTLAMIAAVLVVGAGLAAGTRAVIGGSDWGRMEARPDAASGRDLSPGTLSDTRSASDPPASGAAVPRDPAPLRAASAEAAPRAGSVEEGAAAADATLGDDLADTAAGAPAGDPALVTPTGGLSATPSRSGDSPRPKRRPAARTATPGTGTPRLRDNPYE